MSTRQYVGARYVPKFSEPIEWDKKRSYEALEIVTYLGTSYTSKKPVPVGIEIDNKEFWVVTGNYNAQVEQYRKEVEALSNKIPYVLFEDFGAAGNGVTDDTEAIKNCLNYAKANNVIVTSKNKKYLVSNDIIFDNVVAKNLGTFLCVESKIIIQNSSTLSFFTVENGCIVVDAYYSNVGNFTIKNYDGVCISFQSTTELPDKCVGFDGIHDFLVDNYQLRTKSAVGINCNNNDMKIRNGVLINCNTGIVYDGGNILIDKVHMWINGYVDFDSSVAFDIRRTNFRITNCTVDTYAKIFKVPDDYFGGIIDGLSVIHNTTLKPNVNVQYIDKQYCTLLGNVTFNMKGWNDNGVTLKLFDNAKSNILFIDGQPSDNYRLVQDQLKSSYGGTIISDYGVTVSGDMVWLNINVLYPGAGMPYGTKDTINTSALIEGYRMRCSTYVPAAYTDSSQSTFTNRFALVSSTINGDLSIESVDETVLNIKRVNINIPVKLF